MCDYSLHNVASRSAKVGETLVSGGFLTASTKGFKSSSDGDVAVCLLPGTELKFEEPVHTTTAKPTTANVNGADQTIGVPPRSSDRVATFIQVDKDCKIKHHDALEFADGNILLVNDLTEGQEVTVLTLPAQPKTAAEAAKQERAEFA